VPSKRHSRPYIPVAKRLSGSTARTGPRLHAPMPLRVVQGGLWLIPEEWLPSRACPCVLEWGGTTLQGSYARTPHCFELRVRDAGLIGLRVEECEAGEGLRLSYEVGGAAWQGRLRMVRRAGKIFVESKGWVGCLSLQGAGTLCLEWRHGSEGLRRARLRW
jgi:hypothetical protein